MGMTIKLKQAQYISAKSDYSIVPRDDDIQLCIKPLKVINGVREKKRKNFFESAKIVVLCHNHYSRVNLIDYLYYHQKWLIDL